ncbi:hypothetical protein [Patulibacter defluvii]|uniref:hypothetical protein n=1 Tax=Patulibacter defluvii TaxID=3095358 RepID=UPI002A7646EE|nr:hypothetical protein [Patulibacter sp. DM4]
MSHRPLSRRRGPLLGALVLSAALATAATGCGSSDPDPTTSTTTASTPSTATTAPSTPTTATTSPSTTADPGPGGGAPADDEAAIRKALGQGQASATRARTARIAMKMKIGPIESTSTGTIDLVEQRTAMDQTVSQGGQKTTLEVYGEKQKAYFQRPGSSEWMVTDNPIDTSDPMAQVRQLQKAEIVDVGDVETVDGQQCRWFEARVKVADALENVRDPTVRQAMESAPKDAAIPLEACVDGRGLTYRIEEDYEPSKVLGPVAAAAPRTVISMRMDQYGQAASPERPDGIDDAKPFSLTGGAGGAGAAG